LRKSTYRCGLGIAGLAFAWVKTPVVAVSEKDDEIDAITAAAVGVSDA